MDIDVSCSLLKRERNLVEIFTLQEDADDEEDMKDMVERKQIIRKHEHTTPEPKDQGPRNVYRSWPTLETNIYTHTPLPPTGLGHGWGKCGCDTQKMEGSF